MDNKIRMVEELIPLQNKNSLISSLHKKGVLVGIMDPMTWQHTATHHGDSFEELLERGVGVREQRCGQLWSQQYADKELPGSPTSS